MVPFGGVHIKGDMDIDVDIDSIHQISNQGPILGS